MHKAPRLLAHTPLHVAEVDGERCAHCCTQAQCILFARYPEVLAPFKYAGYPMLLDAAALPAGDDGAHFLGPERAPQLQAKSRCGCIYKSIVLRQSCTVAMVASVSAHMISLRLQRTVLAKAIITILAVLWQCCGHIDKRSTTTWPLCKTYVTACHSGHLVAALVDMAKGVLKFC